MNGGKKEVAWTQLFGLLKTTRVFRLNRIILFVNIRKDFTLIYFLVLYLHLTGWLWFVIHNSYQEWIPPQDYMFVKTELYSQSDLYKYWHSIYSSVNMLSGNEMGPRTVASLIYVSSVIIFGAIVNANIFGSMAVIIQEMNK